MPNEATHIAMSYDWRDIRSDKHAYRTGLGGFEDADSVFIEFEHTRKLFPRNIADDFSGMHGECYKLAKEFEKVPEGIDLAIGTKKHCNLDNPWHEYMLDLEKRLQSAMSENLFPEQRATKYITHLGIEKITERLVHDRFPHIRYQIIESYLHVLPKVPKVAKVLSGYFADYNIRPKIFANRIRFAIAFGISRQVTLNYLRGFPKFDGNQASHNSIDKFIKSAIDSVPMLDMISGFLVPENGDIRLKDPYDQTFLQPIWNFFSSIDEYRPRARYLFKPFLDLKH